VITSEGIKPRSFKAAICSLVVGQPSKIHPLILQSGFSNLVLTRSIISSLGTKVNYEYRVYFTWFASVHSLSQFLSLGWVWFISNIVFDEFIDFHILKFVFLSKLLRVIRFPAAWGSHKQYARWPPGSLRSCQFQYANDFFKNNTLRSVPIELNNLSFAC
jgi:hypothetical protein